MIDLQTRIDGFVSNLMAKGLSKGDAEQFFNSAFQMGVEAAPYRRESERVFIDVMAKRMERP